MPRTTTILLLALLPAAWAFPAAATEEWKTVLDLRGQWKFSTGDDPRRAEKDFRDGSWDEVFVPSPWEEEGFPGYDGFAWYRKHFRTTPAMKDASLYLHLGYVDDACEVYLNGRLVGLGGAFPPDYRSAFDVSQKYPVPPEFLDFTGENVLSVRVYDMQLQGGILRGKVGFLVPTNRITPDIQMPAVWKFRTGDDENWKDPDYDDSNWDNLVVPLAWDAQGYRDYDGYAWYRVRFRMPSRLRGKQMVLLLGQVDDFDEAYVNGTRVGRTGRKRPSTNPQDLGNFYREQRAYTVPAGVFRDGLNTLAVRVWDGMFDGGIYEGPVGFMTRERYREEQRSGKSIWDLFRFLR
ncbi:MAG: beta galactosidase jelly roll domain-containing protein [Bacteroidota bacterium]